MATASGLFDDQQELFKEPRIIAYTRISDKHKQTNATQISSINEYAKVNNITISEWVNFRVSGSKTTTEERGVDAIIEDLQVGDSLVITDIARLGRSDPIELMTTIKQIVDKDCFVHLTYTSQVINSMGTADMGTLFMMLGESIAAVRFAEERSIKAKAAIKDRTERGLSNGRQRGANIKSKLDSQIPFITDSLNNGMSKLELLRQLESRGLIIARSRLYTWLKQRGFS